MTNSRNVIPLERSGQRDQPSISDVIAACGGAALGESPPMEAIEAFLRSLADHCGPQADALRIETLRAEGARVLKGAGMTSPTRMIDAAIPKVAGRERVGDPAELQGQSIECEDPESWPDPVSGGELLDELVRILRRFVVLPDGAAGAAALWVLLSHAQDAFPLLPLLNITSPVKGCGKSTLVDLLHTLVRRPLKADNISASALYRAVELKRPTMLLDEGDAWMDLRDELRGILNAGYTRSGRVLRCVGDSQEVRSFSAFCPKVVAGIGDRAATITDRSITVELQKAAPGEQKERLRRDRLETGEFEHVRRRAFRWALDHLEDLRSADPELPPELPDRPADNWRPLIAIADAAGEGWPGTARRAALLLTGTVPQEDEITVRLLRDLQVIFSERGDGPHASQELATALGAMEDRPWAEWKEGKPLTPAGLARLLKRFRISPNQYRRGPAAGEKIRGYHGDQFADTFSRYLPDPVHPVQSSQGADFPTFSDRYNRGERTGLESAENPRQACNVPGVPDRSTGWEGADIDDDLFSQGEL